MTAKQIIAELRKNGSEYDRKGMARFGINVDKAFGVNVPVMRTLAKLIGKNHELAIELWESGYHEARHVAAMIDDPKLVTKAQMNKWVRDFNSWDICDGTCSNLFRKTPYAIEKIYEWCEKKDEYVRRAGFSLMCYVAVHHKTRDDEEFLEFLPLIKKYSVDERNFVKKAVNWALRQIGKRSRFLNEEALKVAREIHALDSKSAKWIASDAIRELTDPKILARIKR
ncbi:MAG: DNA alkylation repair protein [Stygiobacter sp. RIFOXYC12_FULL_38_8]|nr:MAG: DNA alkylation repair protein [Stygiobacter sp. RIFOXYA12_FULL_38_9]OGV07829.1 MAG: DNA alkylation repair protein [Stygiobacter sp. RIFOXYB2_FULL_37_11]OGV11693.1 MAG: DNA alkylation repair protein [Stygiobacter sp. RIFOXYA2_FULL_38_8]OGV12832.1 MAG: DNA alkylation repair protein [Stygiobacter sp. RIFOXYC2_FULL_38_25]OGV27089.1 MAG: DNA alkylation repair protein [Stygiobacter sp. RIFOXYC12_FULL_38_8]OGV81911.1 MAG: DNA alkylation repair protein [Stygiobacter sp. GWF2_38_21]RJQ60783.1 